MAKARQIGAYLTPSIVLILAFFVVPLIFIIVMSFTRWAGLGPAGYVGIGNYRYLYHDPAFVTAVENTVIWALAGIFIHTPLCLAAALILARQPFMWKVMRTLLFLPSVVSTTILAILWYFLLNVNVGLVNNVLTDIGLKSLVHPWLLDPSTALGAVIAPFVIYIGFGMVLFITQISTIPRELYEAAQLDGASVWQQDLRITIPIIRRTIALQVLFVIGYVLKMFEYPFIMTDGGPINKTMNLSLYMYNQMVTADAYGLSMAAGVVTVVLGAVLMGIALLALRWVEAR